MTRHLKNRHLPGRIKDEIERVFNIRVYRKRNLLHAHDFCDDIHKVGLRPTVIFDVGANIGQSALRFLDAFQGAQVICFEPVPSTFHQLKRNLHGTGARCHNLALGELPETTTMYLKPDPLSCKNSLIPFRNFSHTAQIEVTTIDAFTAEKRIPHIDFLKIDTEGYDLEVLRGAERLLASKRIPFVLAEIGFHRGEEVQALFDDVRDLLAGHGFAVFGIYDQALARSNKRLHFANALFLNEAALSMRISQ